MVTRWSIDNGIKDILVLEGVPVQGIPDSNRSPIVLSGNEEGSTSSVGYDSLFLAPLPVGQHLNLK